jgi:hypothetical protein
MHHLLCLPFRQYAVEAKKYNEEKFQVRCQRAQELFIPGRFDGRNGFGSDSG